MIRNPLRKIMYAVSAGYQGLIATQVIVLQFTDNSDLVTSTFLTNGAHFASSAMILRAVRWLMGRS